MPGPGCVVPARTRAATERLWVTPAEVQRAFIAAGAYDFSATDPHKTLKDIKNQWLTGNPG